MVTTRNGRDTAIEPSSSPRSAKKRASQEDERSSAPNSKRRKAAAPQEEKSEELDGENVVGPPPAHESIVVRPHPDPASTQEADEPQENNATLPVRNHVRFSSTPPPVPELAVEHSTSNTQPQAGATTEEDSDDDGAPESISLSTAHAQTRAAQADAEKVVKEQEAEAKKRRKRRDAQLKAQAKESTKRKGKENQKTNVDRADSKEEANASSYSLTNIPALLPAELLATEAPIRRPTPPPQSTNLIAKNDKKQLKHLSKILKIPQDAAPKDLVLQNNTHVRVLQEANPLLPPKAESRSKEVRESWMKGRLSFQAATRKGKEVGKMQRRVVAKGFV